MHVFPRVLLHRDKSLRGNRKKIEISEKKKEELNLKFVYSSIECLHEFFVERLERIISMVILSN